MNRAVKTVEQKIWTQQAQTCYKELQQLLNETKGWKGLIEEHIQVIRSILEELNHLGLEQENLTLLKAMHCKKSWVDLN